MESALSRESSIPEDVLRALLRTSKSSTLDEALQTLIETSRSDEGRSFLAFEGVLQAVLLVLQSLTFASDQISQNRLLLAIRLLRNLCAGEEANQDLFVELNGVDVVINSVNFDCEDSGYGVFRAALQVLANTSLAGEIHQRVIWDRLFPDVFLKVARVRRREICDPLCMILYTCSDGSSELFGELCKNLGLSIIAEIIRTASEVGFGEDWLKLLISKICLEEPHIAVLFATLCENFGDSGKSDTHITSAQAFLLRTVSEILNERLKEIRINSDFALYILGIFRSSIKSVDFHTRGQTCLPTGVASIDVLGYSLTILRDTCAQDNSVVINSLVGTGLLDELLSLLRELELPSSIRKTMRQDEDETGTSKLPEVCPYKGFRRDIVAVIGNCSYRRPDVQDEVRQKDGVILLLQQCVLDEDNPFLREWGIWCAKNILEGNTENQQLVAELEMQGSVVVPELAAIGLRAEIDHITRQARLVNIT